MNKMTQDNFWNSMVSLALVSFGITSAREVEIVGTTVASGFFRPEGKLMPQCPSTHPYSFGQGWLCCQFQRKLNDPNVDSDCDGSHIRVTSSDKCCYGQVYVDCPDTIVGCNTALSVIAPPSQPTCTQDPTILQSQSSASYNNNNPIYSAPNALTYEACEVEHGGTYHLFPDTTLNQHFVIDFGCQLHIAQFTLRNTKNGNVANRGTRDFTLEMSLDNNIWNLVVQGTLEDVRSVDRCQLPEKTFSAYAHGRYVRFTALTYYASGSGLNYITWEVVAE